MFCFEAKYAVLLLLVFQNTCLVLLMRYSRTRPGTMYLGSTAVCCDEAMKFVTCVGILFVTFWRERREATEKEKWTRVLQYDEESEGDDAAKGKGEEKPKTATFRAYLRREVFNTPKEYMKMGGLAMLYTVQKNLLYIAVSNLDAAVFQVTYQTKILTTALFSVLLLKRKLCRRKVAALLVLTLGVALVQLDKVDENASQSYQSQQRWVGVLAVLGACCTSGFGGVYFEWVLKRNPSVDEVEHYKPPSVWAKNVQLSSFAFVIALITAYVKDGAVIRADGFFGGYSPLVVGVVALEAGGGLVVAAVIKYADNILKSFATAVSIVTSTIVSMYVFGFLLSKLFVVGSLLVFVAIYVYSKEDPDSGVSTKETARGSAVEMSVTSSNVESIKKGDDFEEEEEEGREKVSLLD